jgi:hypothetical protein
MSEIKTLCSGLRNLDGLFVINIYKGKTNSHTIMNTVSLHVPTKLVRDVSIFVVSNSVRCNFSARFSSFINSIRQSLDVFNRHI